MVKFSLYMTDGELRMLEEGQEIFQEHIGIKISRNNYIKNLIFEQLVNNGVRSPTDVEVELEYNEANGYE